MKAIAAGLIMIMAAATAAQAAEVTGVAEIGKKYGLISVIQPDKTVKVCYKAKDVNYKMGDLIKAEYVNDENGVCTINKVQTLEAKGNDKPQIKLPLTDETSVSVAEFLQHVGNNTALILDIREEDEFKAGHIPTAVNVPMPSIMPAHDFVQKEANGRLIIMQCNTSVRAELAAYMYQKAGINAKFIRGEVVFNKDGWKVQEKQKK